MPPSDPLSNLLQQWQPQSPDSARNFTEATMQRLRQERSGLGWGRLMFRLDDWLEEWLPSPGRLLPVAAALVLLITVQHWKEADERAQTLAAMSWQQELSQPISKASLTGIYSQSSNKL